MRLPARLAACLLVVLAILPLGRSPAEAEDPKQLRGVALIIGNGAYQHLTPLSNPETDARAIEDLFDDLGFETFDARDADARKLRRAIERFIEDAEGADVAVLYYAGHGIEAGGENFLIPVDADLSALESAGDKLVPLSKLLAELKAAVPVTIILLDACRNNPFPPGSQVRLEANAAPVAIGSGGLGETRSVTPMARAKSAAAATPAAESLGEVIGFAAEPGRTALDGQPGENSPYAAAVIRHIQAMTGEEFGTVMRMVAEEVYLKTGGQQRPWVNESLRRLLYFGGSPDAPQGAEGDILRERRQLLVTISGLPDIERRQVESVARDGNVPMDAVYGMLRALGQDAPKDPAQLEALLREQTAKIKQMQSERAAISSSDPEILRLSELASDAIAEGALETAVSLHDQAKARVQVVEKTVENAEADIKARRMEFAEVYARSGETNFMTFNFEQSAKDYEAAFHQVERWDDWAAWSHRGNQAVALQKSGWQGGKTEQLRQAAVLAREIVERSSKLPGRGEWATSQTFLGNTLVTLGQRENDVAMLTEAAEAYEAALTVYAEGSGNDPERLDVLHNLAGALFQIGNEKNDEAMLLDAIARFDDLTRMVPRDQDALIWSRTMTVKATAMTDLARLRQDDELLGDAIGQLQQALEVRQRDALPDDWAETTRRLAVAYSDLGIMRKDAGLVRKADELFLSVTPQIDRATRPVVWSEVVNNAGINAHHLAFMVDDWTEIERAIGLFRQAQGARDRVQLPELWADSQSSIAGALCDLGRLRKDVSLIEEGIAAHREAAQVFTRPANPVEWSRTQSKIGDSLRNIGDIEGSMARIAESLDVQAAALAAATEAGNPAQADDVRERIVAAANAAERLDGEQDQALLMATLDKAASLLSDGKSPGALAAVQTTIGRALYDQAVARKDPALFEQSIAAYRKALVPEARTEPYRTWSNTQSNLALALRELARLPDQKGMRAQALAAWREAQLDEKDEQLWIGIQRNIASLLDDMGSNGDVARLREAADAWRGLATRLPESDVEDRANAMENRGIALQNVAYYTPGGDAAALEEAAAAYRSALSGFKPDKSLESWERVTENLADMQRILGQQNNDAARLEEASDLYRGLSARVSRADDGGRWARVQGNLATALATHAALKNDPAELDRAIDIFRGVLGPDIATKPAEDWRTAAAFAQALRNQGRNNRAAGPLKESVAVLASLSLLPPDKLSEQDRAFVRSNEGDSLILLGEVENSIEPLKRAIAAYRDADRFYTPENFPGVWRYARSSLANALLTFGYKAPDRPSLSEATGIYRSLIAGSSREVEPAMWASFANGIGWGLTQLSRNGDKGADLAEAVKFARDAMDSYRAAGSALEAAQSQDTLCGALTELGRQKQDRAPVEEAITACDSALAAFREHNDALLIHYAEESRARATALLDELKK